MKKYSLLIIVLLASCFILSACTTKPNSTIKYERRLGKYFGAESNSTPQGGMVDLSEGPKLNYDANLGPRDLNFDMKIVTPY